MTLVELLEQMNRALPRVPRHFNKGVMFQSSRYAPGAHCVLDLNPQEIDRENAPASLHAQAPEEG